MPDLRVRWFSVVHLVDSHDELFDSKGVRKQSVFSCLAIIGDASLKLSSSSSYYENCTVSLQECHTCQICTWCDITPV